MAKHIWKFLHNNSVIKFCIYIFLITKVSHKSKPALGPGKSEWYSMLFIFCNENIEMLQ